jgi:hypothetical protein
MDPNDPAHPPPSQALLDAVAAAKGSRVRTRRPALALAAALLVALSAGAAMVALRGVRGDLPSQPRAPWLLLGAAWLAGLIAPLALALVPRRGQVLPRTAAARAAAIAGALGLVALPFVLARVTPDSRVAKDGAELARATLSCLSVGLLLAIAPLAAGALALWRTLPVGARSIGAALGAAGGALGGLALHLHCAWAEPLHVALGHGGAVIVGALVGALLAPLLIDARP